MARIDLSDREAAAELLRRTLRESGGRVRAAARKLGTMPHLLTEALTLLGMRDEPERQWRAANSRFRLLPHEIKPWRGIRLREMPYHQHPMQAKIQVDPKGAAEELAELYTRAKCNQKRLAEKLQLSEATIIRYVKKLDARLGTKACPDPMTRRLARIKASAIREGWHHHDLGGRPVGS